MELSRVYKDLVELGAWKAGNTGPIIRPLHLGLIAYGLKVNKAHKYVRLFGMDFE